jgi:hypothetical protein
VAASEEYAGFTRLERAATAFIPNEEDCGRYLTGVEACLAYLHEPDKELFLRWQAELLERQHHDPG